MAKQLTLAQAEAAVDRAADRREDAIHRALTSCIHTVSPALILLQRAQIDYYNAVEQWAVLDKAAERAKRKIDNVVDIKTKSRQH